MISKFVDAKYVIAKLYRDLQLNEEISESDMYEWIGEALSMIGSYSQYNEVSNCLELVDGKAKLPLGFEKLVDINYKGLPVYWATNTNASNYQCEGCKIPTCVGYGCDYTFYINNNYLISNIKSEEPNNKICIVYLSVPVNKEGIPLVPDDIYYFKALTAYITHMLDYADWRRGKTTDKVYQKSEQDWLFYVNSARGSANMPNVQQLENFKNIWRRLSPVSNDYKRGFSNFNKGENFNI